VTPLPYCPKAGIPGAPRQPKLLDAGGLPPEISSFRLYLAAEGKAATTVRTYTEAVQWSPPPT
jgi:hypothetical protein